MRYTLPACCASAASGAAATPSARSATTATTKSRLFIRSPSAVTKQCHHHDRRTESLATVGEDQSTPWASAVSRQRHRTAAISDFAVGLLLAAQRPSRE